MTRKISALLLAIAAFAASGCGSGAFERLGDIPDHCKIGPARQGWIDLNLQCVCAETAHKPLTNRNTEKLAQYQA